MQGFCESNAEEWTKLNDDNTSGKSTSTCTKNATKKNNDSDYCSNDGVVNESSKFDTIAVSLSSNLSVGSAGSVTSGNSRGSGNSKKSVKKRRSWRKPKDKPKRPLSAYNIFFKHTRSRIVEGLPEEGSIEETIQSIEAIVANSTETRRHRKTHGQISFGDLARKIADNWKTISKDQRSLFDHYASLDMKRYRRDVSIWKAKKEQEAIAAKMGRVGVDGVEIGGNSSYSSFSDFSENMDHFGNSLSSNDDWAPRYRAHDSLSSSFHSLDSELSMEPVPIADIEVVDPTIQSTHQRNDHYQTQGNQLNQQLQYRSCVPTLIESSNMQQNSENSLSTNSNSTDINEKKLQDIRLKNRELEQSINQLKMELSATSFLDANVHGSNTNPFDNRKFYPQNEEHEHQLKYQQQNITGLNAPLTGGPSIDRMQSLHRRRQIEQINPLRDFIFNGTYNESHVRNDASVHDTNHGSFSDHLNNDHDHNIDRSEPLRLEEGFESPVVRNKKSISQQDISMTPNSMCEVSPVPFEEVFSKDIANRNEMIKSLSNLDI